MKRLAKIGKESDTEDQWQGGTSPTDLDGDVDKEHFESPELRRKSPARFVKGCNWAEPHKSLDNSTSIRNTYFTADKEQRKCDLISESDPFYACDILKVKRKKLPSSI